MRKECRTCRHCKEWEEHRGLYCNNEEGINYTFDVADCDKCEKWERKMRIIDADTLIKNYFDRCRTEFEVINHCMTDENVVHIIQNAPTVEYPFYQEAYQTGYEEGKNERPQGKWEEPFELNGKTYHKCTNCHISSQLILINNYCPYCGAKMKGGRE